MCLNYRSDSEGRGSAGVGNLDVERDNPHIDLIYMNDFVSHSLLDSALILFFLFGAQQQMDLDLMFS